MVMKSIIKNPKPIQKGDSVEYQAWHMPSVRDAALVKRDSVEDKACKLYNTLPPKFKQALTEQAQQEGYQAGNQAGFNAAVQQHLPQLEQLIVALFNHQQNFDQELEKQVLELTMCLVKKIIQSELSAQPEKIIEIIQDVKQKLPYMEQNIQLSLSSDDAAFLKKAQQESDLIDDHWQIVEDANLGRGDCIVQSQAAEVDGRLDTRIGQMMMQMLTNRDSKHE